MGFENDLKSELLLKGQSLSQEWGRLLLTEATAVAGSSQEAHPVWAQNTWLEPEWLEVSSISDAVKKLKERQYLWTYYENNDRPHGRAKLIQEIGRAHV